MNSIAKIYRWVPSLYFMQGLPFALVVFVAPVFYKNFNFSNTKIALFTSILTLPWMLKPLLAPIVEFVTTRRLLVSVAQLIIAILVFVLALSCEITHLFYVTCTIYLLIAFASAINDISSDGMYIVSLNTIEQAHFLGIRSMFWQLGRLFCQGFLIFLAGFFLLKLGGVRAWEYTFILLGTLIFALASYHFRVLPKNAVIKKSAVELSALSSFNVVFKELVQLPHFLIVMIFVFLYNFPESQLIKIVPLFLLDSGLTTQQVGIVYGGIGAVSMLIGITLSGLLLTKYSLKRCFIPITMLLIIANLGYLPLSILNSQNIFWVSVVIIIAQFAYGLSNGAYMYYLLRYFSRGAYPMSLYAIGTSLMAFGVLLAGSLSGFLQYLLGYNGFFGWIIMANVIITAMTIYTIRKNVINE